MVWGIELVHDNVGFGNNGPGCLSLPSQEHALVQLSVEVPAW